MEADLLSAAMIRSRPRDGARARRSALPSLLLALFLLYIFVGVSPLAEADASTRTDGNPLDRLAALSLAALATGLIAVRARTVGRVMRRSALVWLMVGWITASLVWSDYPDLTLRRAISIDLVALVCLALAASLPDPRRIHLLLATVLTAVILANVAATVLLPGIAISDIGVRGIYPQKNQAGLVGMITVVVALSWVLQARGGPAVVAGLGAAAAAGGFLLVTDSKTSIALTLLAVAALPAILALRRLGRARAGLCVVLGLATAGVVALFFTAIGGNWIAVASGGDASFTGRTEIWNFVLGEIGRRPWFGTGYGAFWDVGLENDPLLRAPPGEWLAQVKIGVINQAHDGFLDLLVQGGIPMLVLALAVWAQAAFRLVGLVFADDRRAARVFWTLCLILMVILLFHNITETSLWARGQMLASLNILVTLLAAAAPRPADAERGATP